MSKSVLPPFTVFAGQRCMISGGLVEVATVTKRMLDGGETAPILIFDNASSHTMEIDFRGVVADVVARLKPPQTATLVAEVGEDQPEQRRAGRPKLGVVGREVTLLPRHWDWLGTQPGGASVALRKLVDEARKTNISRDMERKSHEVAYRFMVVMAGNLPDFEEATRALFASDRPGFEANTAKWPADIRDHARALAQWSAALTVGQDD